MGKGHCSIASLTIRNHKSITSNIGGLMYKLRPLRLGMTRISWRDSTCLLHSVPELTPWNRALEKLSVAQEDNKLYTYNGTRTLIIVFTGTDPMITIQSHMDLVHILLPYFWRYILMLSCNPRLRVTSCFFISRLKCCMDFSFFPTRVTCPSHLTVLNLNTLIFCFVGLRN